MTTPDWLKPGIYGAIGGAVLVAIVGFSWGGWMTSSSANTMASEMARNDVITAMIPVCVGLSRADPTREAQLASIRDVAAYRQRDAVMATGWATMPGADAPSRDLAQACIAELDLEAS